MAPLRRASAAPRSSRPSSPVTSAIIAAELSATKPLSVTRAEEIAALRAWARDRTVTAS